MRSNGQTPLWVAARTLLTIRGEDFKRRLDTTLLTFDPEAIHDLRVSSRRLREGVALFAPCYPADMVGRLLRRVRKVTRLLGEIRNRDEACLFFTALRDQMDGSCDGPLERLITEYEQERGAELQRLDSGLRSMAAVSLPRRVRRLVSAPALFDPPDGATDPFSPLADFGRQALGERLDFVLQLVPSARQAENVLEQHQLRIAVKHFRYRLEILSSLFGEAYEEVHGAVKGYQELLGTMHDLDVFAMVILEARFPAAAAETVLGTIAAKRAKLFDKFSTRLETLPFEELGRRLGLEAGGSRV